MVLAKDASEHTAGKKDRSASGAIGKTRLFPCVKSDACKPYFVRYAAAAGFHTSVDTALARTEFAFFRHSTASLLGFCLL